MIWVTVIFFTLLFFYACTLIALASGFFKLPKFEPVRPFVPVPVTIIICARNEEKTITSCLRSILAQDYDPTKIQLLLINDASTDATVALAERALSGSDLRYRIVSNIRQKGKKHSISQAMPFADNDLIILRDADTFTRSVRWLQAISAFYQASDADLIVAPVAIADNFGTLWALQAIENNILALIAGGSSFLNKPFLCNGANLAFKKSLFESTGGYASHMELASGDDIFFMEDAKKIPGTRINYLRSADAIVSTYPCYSFKQLIRQKIRWASKFKTNKNPLNRLLAFLGFAVNAAWLFCFVACYFISERQDLCLIFIFLKLSIDFLLLFLASGFIKNRSLWWFALPVGCIYPIYATLVSLASVITKPTWKT